MHAETEEKGRIKCLMILQLYNLEDLSAILKPGKLDVCRHSSQKRAVIRI